MKKLYLSITFMVLFFSTMDMLFGQSVLIEKTEPASNSLIIPYEKWKLGNGLTLIITEDHSDPVVTVMVQCHVGSARESIGKSGFAHLFEHMMFEGSGHVGGKEAEKIVSEVGGNGNAFTERDITTYFETVPSNNLEVALWMESDRMGFLLDSVTQERFENQRATVKNEKGQNFENKPYGLTEEVLDQALYPPTHPYSWPVIGFTNDLDRVTVEDLRNFFLRWYGPNNSVLTIAGDVNSKEVLALVEKYFGSIPSCPDVKKMKIPAPLLAEDKYANYIDNVYAPATVIAYPTVPAYHRDAAALDLLAAMMGEGKNTVFYKNFDKSEKAEASVGHKASELSGEFIVEVISYPDYHSMNYEDIPEDKAKRDRWMHEFTMKNFNQTEKLIHESIDEFEKTGIADSVLQRAKAKKESEIVNGVESTFQKALLLSNWQILIAKTYNLKDEMNRYDKVTADDISRVFNKYIKDKHAATVNVYPRDQDSNDSTKSFNPNANIKITPDPEYAGLKYVKAKDNFDRNQKPVSGPAKTPVVPQYYKHQLKNGLKIIGTQSAKAPTVFMLIKIKGGDYVISDLKKTGLAEMTAAMMNEGTKNYSTEQISAELDGLGSSITFSADGENTTVTVNCLIKNAEATIKLLEEKLMNPGFNPEDFKRIKTQFTESMASERKNADRTAYKIYNNLIYGNNAPGIFPSEKNVAKLTLNDVKNYYNQYYSPAATEVVVVGDIAERDLMKQIDFFNQWKGKEVKMPEMSSFPVISQTQIYLADKEGTAQSIILIGNLSMPFDATGEFFKANAMNYSLGGAFNSRLNLNLREDKGYSYGSYSYFNGTKYPGTFTVYAAVKRSATDSCISEIMKELNNIKTSGLKDDEVAFTKSSLLNSQALKYESPRQKAGFLAEIEEYDLSSDFTTKQSEIIKYLAAS